MPKYKLNTPESIAESAKIARNHADRQPNQGSYNAAWMHGYAEALTDVARQLSLDKGKANPVQDSMESQEDMIPLWARVGMTICVSKDIYDQLLQSDQGNLLQDIIIGKKGRAYLDGETYFPDSEQNMSLADREYDLYYRYPIGISSEHNHPLNTRDLNHMIKAASDRSTDLNVFDSNQNLKATR